MKRFGVKLFYSSYGAGPCSDSRESYCMKEWNLLPEEREDLSKMILYFSATIAMHITKDHGRIR